MLKINKENNSIVVEGLDNVQYPHDGNLVFPLNSLMMVLDESDIVTFRSAANADTVFGGNINEIEIGGSAVDKDSIVAAWESVANASQGGGGEGSGDFQTVDGKPMWTDEFLASGKYEQGWAKIYDMRLADSSIRPTFGETIKWATTQQNFNINPVNHWGIFAFDNEGVNITFYDLSTRGFPNNKIQLTVDGEVLEYEYNTLYFVGKDSTLKFDLLKKEGDDWVVDNDAWAYKGIIMNGAFIDNVDVFSEVTNIGLKAGDIEVITRPTFDYELANKADKSDNITNIYVTGDGSYRKDGNSLFVTSPVVNDNTYVNSKQAGLHYGIDIVSLDTWEDIVSNKFYELNPLNTEYAINNIFEDGSLNYRVNLEGRQLSMKVPIAEYPNTYVSLLYKRNGGYYNIQRMTPNSNGVVYFFWYNDAEKVWFKIEPYADRTIVEDYVYGTPIDGTVLSTKMQGNAYIKYFDNNFGENDIHLATKDEGGSAKPNYGTFMPDFDADRIAENGMVYYWNGTNGMLVTNVEIPFQFSREDDKAYLFIGDALSVGTDHTFNVLFYVKGISEDGTFHQSFEYFENVPFITKYELGDMLPFGDAGTEWYVAVEEYDADGEMVDWGEREVSEQFTPSRDAYMIPMKFMDDAESYEEVAMKWQLDELRNDLAGINELLERLLN